MGQQQAYAVLIEQSGWGLLAIYAFSGFNSAGFRYHTKKSYYIS